MDLKTILVIICYGSLPERPTGRHFGSESRFGFRDQSLRHCAGFRVRVYIVLGASGKKQKGKYLGHEIGPMTY